ncbi:MAG TPA: MBL fold metallo-hydrolase [Rhodanobacteraceae bacterium]|nr:MBL fold metallo-hydrolase [Rhodanobacteraceae bacterium]
MQVTFRGAAGDVTGSMHEVEAAGKRLLLDCGMAQGDRDSDAQNEAPFPFDVTTLDAVVISHAHIDHIGRLPLLVKRGYNGPIFAQSATADLMRIMLEDSAGIAESRARRHNSHLSVGEQPDVPLYSEADVAATMELVRPIAYGQRTAILPGIELQYEDAGHILGSASIQLWADDAKLVFSGDLGVCGTPILRDPAPIASADLLLMESTYGGRDHKTRAGTVAEIGEILEAAWQSHGNVLIPAFAVGRSQELLYWFAKHYDDWNLGRWKIFLDSPMAAKVIEVYDRHEDLFDADAVKVFAGKPNPFRMPTLQITDSRDDSKAINDIRHGAIIIAGSGMANGGRIVHHLMQNLGRREAHVIFVGYQANGTLGRRLVSGADHVRIQGRDFTVNAQIHTVGGLSGHADQNGLMDWYSHFQPSPALALIHGEDDSRGSLADKIQRRFGVTATLPTPGTRLAVGSRG